MTETMPNELIDWDYLHHVSSHSREFEQELLQILLDTLPPHLELLKASIAAEDYETVEQEAHYIKGSTASVGVKSIERLAAQLEQQVHNRSLESAATLISEIEKTFGDVKDCINQHFNFTSTSN